MAKTRVLLIEDNRLLREGIAESLEMHGGFEIVARSEDGDAIGMLEEKGQEPDVVLLDLGLEESDSLQLMALLGEKLPDARVIAMDILPESVDLVEFVKAGGAGFILKSASIADYVSTIQAVARGENVLPTVLTTSLFTEIVQSALHKDGALPRSDLRLTAREKEVVELISEGLSNKEIATQLHIATHTVKSHVHNVLEKLALSSRLEIAAFVHRKDPE